MKQFLKTAGILALVCFVSALLLALVDSGTRDAISRATEKKKEAARALVFPAAEYAEMSFVPEEDWDAAFAEIFGKTPPRTRALVSTNYILAKDEAGRVLAYIFDVTSPGGYGGGIELVVGVAYAPDEAWGSAALADYLIISSSETPGLGTGAEQAMRALFERKGVFDIDPADRKTDAVSGATITSVAIKDALAAALQTASLIMYRNWVNLDIPAALLGIIPYAQSFETISGFADAKSAVRELVDVRWYGQTSGYLMKSFHHDEETQTKRIGLAGFTAGSRRLYAARLFIMPQKAEEAFIPEPTFRAQLFFGREPASWYTNAMLTTIESNFAYAVFEGHELLRKEGRLP